MFSIDVGALPERGVGTRWENLKKYFQTVFKEFVWILQGQEIQFIIIVHIMSNTMEITVTIAYNSDYLLDTIVPIYTFIVIVNL